VSVGEMEGSAELAG